MNDQKVAYTPGPWDASRDGTPDYHYQATISDESGERVATAFGSEANAQLIAAAPDLLEAAKSVIGIHIAVENGTSDLKELSYAVADLLEAVRKVDDGMVR